MLLLAKAAALAATPSVSAQLLDLDTDAEIGISSGIEADADVSVGGETGINTETDIELGSNDAGSDGNDVDANRCLPGLPPVPQ